jgi:hypothetical protein
MSRVGDEADSPLRNKDVRTMEVADENISRQLRGRSKIDGYFF